MKFMIFMKFYDDSEISSYNSWIIAMHCEYCEYDSSNLCHLSGSSTFSLESQWILLLPIDATMVPLKLRLNTSIFNVFDICCSMVDIPPNLFAATLWRLEDRSVLYPDA